MPAEEVFISVDVETSGPVPGQFSLLSIGACRADDPENTFYVELQPVHMDARPEALRISGLSLERLAEEGVAPAEAMARFAYWVESQTPEGSRPVFTAFNAVFDWMFVADYFGRYLGRNPFGHTALDLKALYMGLTGANWSETSFRHVAARYGRRPHLEHNALADALDQAQLFRDMLYEAQAHRWVIEDKGDTP